MNLSRQLRLLGLAMLALVATGALGATGAQAGVFTAGAFPATVTGSTSEAHEFGTLLGTMKCGPSFDAKLEAASGTLTVVPNYGTSCKLGIRVVHVKNNGCDFRWNAGNTQEADVVSGSMDIVCPDNQKMDFEVTSEPVCHLTVPGQAELGTLTYTNNTAAGDVDLDFNLGNVFYELDNGCPFVGAFFGGTYKGSSTLTADHEGAGTTFQVD